MKNKREYSEFYLLIVKLKRLSNMDKCSGLSIHHYSLPELINSPSTKKKTLSLSLTLKMYLMSNTIFLSDYIVKAFTTQKCICCFKLCVVLEQEYSMKQLANLVNVCLGSHINKKARQKLLAAIDDIDRPKR